MQVTDFVGPASMLVMGIWDDIWMNCMDDEEINTFGYAPPNNLNKISNGRIAKFWKQDLKQKSNVFFLLLGQLTG